MKSDLQSLAGKLVLVTGASRGIGRAVALAAAGAGAELVITGRTIGALEELDDQIKATGGKATIVEMDLKDTAAIPRLATAINRRWGRLDGLVLNAGMLPALTPVVHVKPDVWDECLAINLSGQWHLIKAMDQLLRVAPAGRAILVSSGAAVGSKPFWAPYAAAKAGLEALGRSWAGESEQTNLRINILNPGDTATMMRAAAFPGEDKATLPQPEDIAPAFIHLLSPDCTHHGTLLSAREMLDLKI